MIAELLFVLEGYDSVLFNESTTPSTVGTSVDEPEENGNHDNQMPANWQLNAKIENDFDPGETELVNKLLKLAGCYKRIRMFLLPDWLTDAAASGVARPCSSNSVSNKSGRPFRDALSESLENGVLARYRAQLTRLYQMHSTSKSSPVVNGRLSLPYVLYNLGEYQVVFTKLVSVLDDIQVKLAGLTNDSQILQILWDHSLCGCPIITETLNQLIFDCHRVWFYHLSSWLSYGRLSKQCNGFFIKSCPKPSENKGHSRQNQVDQVGTEESHHCLAEDCIPNYLQRETAEKILASGNIVKIFSSWPKHERTPPIESSLNLDYHAAFVRSKLDPIFGRQVCGLSNVATKSKDLVNCTTATTPAFNPLHFEWAIDSIYLSLATAFWKILLHENDLLGHVDSLRDFYLLGRGEMFLAFIEQGHTMLAKDADKVSSGELNNAFNMAASTFYSVEESVLKLFSLSIAPWKSNMRHHTKDSIAPPAWRCVQLDMPLPPWPLQLLFLPSALEKLNQVFRLLFRVRWVQYRLHRCWVDQNRPEKRNFDPCLTGKSQYWHLRMLMGFLLNNFEQYFQEELIGNTFASFRHQLASCGDFASAQAIVTAFLDALLAHSFLQSDQVHQAMDGVLDICEEYAKLFQVLRERVLQERHRTAFVKQLHDLYLKFQQQSTSLYGLLADADGHRANPHLIHLLGKLDFNKYFSNTTMYEHEV